MALRIEISGMARLALAAVVGALTYACTADAVQTANTPNAAFISYTLAPNATSINYNPVANVSTQIMANCTTNGVRGIGQVSLLRIPGQYVEWVGIHSTGNGTNTHGFSGTEGDHILQIDFFGQVWLEVGTSGGTGSGTRDSIRIHNESPGSRAGNMTWMW